MKRAMPLVLILFTLSGVSGLVYELVWIRLLSQLLGGTTFAISVVLAAFMGGLALGSRFFGARADATRRPLRLYAMLELAIAIFALGVHVAIVFLKPSYVALAQSLPEGSLVFLRVGITLLLLLPPTFFMGGTLPVLGRFIVRRSDRLGRSLGLLYAVNTFGAVLGVFLTGFVFIPQLGLVLCTLLAAALNLLIAMLILIIDRFQPELDSASRSAMESKDADDEPAEIHAGLLAFLFAASGFAAMGYELYWTRALDHFLGNSTYAFSTMLTTFLLGLSLGGWIGGRIADRVKSPAAWLGRIQIAAALTALATVPLIWEVLPRLAEAAWFSGTSLNWNAYLSHRFLAALLIMALPTLLLGMTFPLVNRIGIRGLSRLGWGIGRLYFANTLGSIAGSLFAGFLLLPFLGAKGAILATALIGAFIGLAVHLANRRRGRWEPWIAGILVMLMAAGSPRLLDFGRNLMADSQVEEDLVLFDREDPTAETRVYTKADGTMHMAVDGHHIGGTEPSLVRKEKILAHLPMCLLPEAKRTLSVGLGSGVTLGTLALYDEVEELVCVEIVPGVVDGARFFGKANNHVLDDPRTRMVLGDGVQFLLTYEGEFDLISSDSKLNPEYSGNAALLSVDYYELCRDRLSTDGIMVQWLATHLPATEVRTVTRSFQAAFPHAAIFWLDPYNIILVGSQSPLVYRMDRARAFLESENILADLRILMLDDPYVMPSLFIAGDERLAEGLGEGLVNSWSRPILEFSTVREYRVKSRSYHEDENLRWLSSRRQAGGLPISGAYEPGRLADARLVSSKLLEGYSAGGGVGRLNSGRAAFEEALASVPGDRRMTGILGALDRVGEVLEHKAASTGDVGSLVQLGLQRRDEKRFREALDVFDDALKLRPNDVNILYDRILTLKDLGQMADLEVELYDFRKANPNDPRGISLEGRLMADRGRHQEALALFQLAAEQDPGSTAYQNNIATALVRLERFEEAGEAFAQLYELDPNYPSATYFAAACYSKASLTAESARWMDVCLEKRQSTYEQFETSEFFENLRNSPDWRVPEEPSP
jgi:spermidine synthase